MVELLGMQEYFSLIPSTIFKKLAMVVNIYNPSTQEVGTGESEAQSHPGLRILSLT